MQTIYIDLSNKMVLPTIYAKQGDVGRKFEVVFTDSGVPYNIPDVAHFSVWYDGDSGSGNYTDIGSDSAFTVNGNRVVVEMIAQMLLRDGNGVLCLVMNKNESQIGSWNIPYVCENVPGAESESAESYYTAFSTAVEKLKTTDASLKRRGYPADAKATGDKIKNLTYSDVGAAPGGYGYGEPAQGLGNHTTESDLEAALNDIITELPESASKQVLFIYDGIRFYATVYKRSSTAMTVEATAYTSGLSFLKIFNNSEWFPIVWTNPYMREGIEYPIKETYGGKRLYTKRINCGTLPNSSTKNVSTDLSNCTFISLKVTATSGTLMYELPILGDTAYRARSSMNGSKISIKTSEDMSAYTATAIVKYTKD